MAIMSRTRKSDTDNKGKDKDILCPRCGTPCKGRVDKSLAPSLIGSSKVYPLVIVCRSCGKSTALRYLNDGFNRGYTYSGNQGPEFYMGDAIRLSVQMSSEKDPARKATLAVDLAGAYWHTRDYALAEKTLAAISLDRASYGRRAKLDDDTRMRMAALWYHLRGGTKQVKQMIREFKMSVDSIEGPYAALFTACCCRDCKGVEERERMYRRTMEIAGSCDPDDYMVIFARYMSSLYVFHGIESMRNEVASEMTGLTYRLADIMESEGFPTDWDFLFSSVFEHTMRMLLETDSRDEGYRLSSEMRRRFCSDRTRPRGGLYSIVAYASAGFLLGIGEDRDVALNLLKDIEDIVVDKIDNGPFTIDRVLVATIVYDAMGGEGAIDPLGSFDMIMEMGRGKEALANLMEIYTRAFSGSKTPSEVVAGFLREGIAVDPCAIVKLMETPFDPLLMWDNHIIRPFFDI